MISHRLVPVGVMGDHPLTHVEFNELIQREEEGRVST
jgi:hypothetical protein